jgi:hypothetical protein
MLVNTKGDRTSFLLPSTRKVRLKGTGRGGVYVMEITWCHVGLNGKHSYLLKELARPIRLERE